MRSLSRLLVCVVCVCLATSCHDPSTDFGDTWHMSQHEQDSVLFAKTHHYSVGFNFVLSSDSLLALSSHPAMPQSLLDTSYTVFTSGDRIVVADIVTIASDSTPTTYWIKVARDQMSIGWVDENELLTAATPADPISRVIHAFSHQYLFSILFIAIGTVLFFLYWRIGRPAEQVKRLFIISPYPLVLTIVAALCSTIYGSIQCFCPTLWKAYYFHPSINPLFQPWSISALLLSLWLYVLVWIATVDELRRRLGGVEFLLYIFFMAIVHVFIYLLFSFSVEYWVGYLLWPAIIYALCRMRGSMPSLLCGHCHRAIPHLGRCPHCGTLNQ